MVTFLQTTRFCTPNKQHKKRIELYNAQPTSAKFIFLLLGHPIFSTLRTLILRKYSNNLRTLCIHWHHSCNTTHKSIDSDYHGDNYTVLALELQ